MALTYTPPGELGFLLPTFTLQSVDAKEFHSGDFKSARALVVLFICNHCPYVQAIEDRMIALAKDLQPKGAQFLGICSNDSSEYPEDHPAALRKRWSEKAYGFPYLVDETQEVAKQFSAVCTPDIFVFDQEQKLAYRGRFDDSWRDSSKVQKQELRIAIEAILQGQTVPKAIPSMGCSIKWK